MSALSFSAVGESDQARGFATLVLAFAADPVERWLYPEPQQYLSHFPRFLAAFGGRAFAERTVWSLGEFCAVALWLPPGTEADGDAITTLLTETVAADKHDDTFAVLGPRREGNRAPRLPALVPAVFRRRHRLAGQEARQSADGALPADRRRQSPARLPRNPQPAHYLLL